MTIILFTIFHSTRKYEALHKDKRFEQKFHLKFYRKTFFSNTFTCSTNLLHTIPRRTALLISYFNATVYKKNQVFNTMFCVFDLLLFCHNKTVGNWIRIIFTVNCVAVSIRVNGFSTSKQYNVCGCWFWGDQTLGLCGMHNNNEYHEPLISDHSCLMSIGHGIQLITFQIDSIAYTHLHNSTYWQNESNEFHLITLSQSFQIVYFISTSTWKTNK